MMQFDILTIFPEIFPAYLETSILGRAQKDKLVGFGIHNIRDFAEDKHNTVDDTPYGGGAGMVLKIEPIAKALDSIKNDKIQNPKSKSNLNDKMSNDLLRRTVVLAARGEQFTQAKAEEYSKLDQLTLICGRYEGIDQRVADHLADEELSIGPYVLNGGEVAALTVIEAVARLVPGVLGNPESLKEESYALKEPQTTSHRQGYGRQALGSGRSASRIEYPQYTKPEDYKGWRVPNVLLSGDHAKIKRWREGNRK